MRVRRWIGLALTTSALAAISGAPAGAITRPNARPFGGIGAVGALFFRTPHGGLGRHFCSASVVNSPSGDLVVTAAHCMDGRAPGRVAFVPGYADGRHPYGVWLVRRVIRDSTWVARSAPDHDIAFLLVGRAGTARTVQSMTGGEGLGAPADHQRVLTVGYLDNMSRPVGCVNVIRNVGSGRVEFDCGGYTNGTSGGPLIASVSPATGLGVIVGVIGGYERGGYTDAVSYTPRFGHQVAALYGSAVRLSVHWDPHGGSRRPAAGRRLRFRGRGSRPSHRRRGVAVRA